MKIVYLTIALVLTTTIIWAQEKMTGKVYNNLTKEAIAGAQISIKGLAASTTSDINGAFTIKVVKGQTILVTNMGYQDTTIAITGSNNINIALKPSNQLMDEIIVSANRTAQRRSDAPISITKITAQTIADTKPRDILELVNKVPGVVMTNLNNEQHSMSIRQPMGSTSAYHLYLEDGIPIRTMGVFNHNSLIEINIPAINHIEVIKGPASSIYGPEAIGGSINFMMLKPTTLTTAKAGVQLDNYGYRRYNMAATGSLSKKIGYAININKTMQRDGWLANTDFDKTAFTSRLDYKISSKTLVWASYTHIDYETQASGSIDSLRFYSRKYHSSTGFTYRKVYAKRFRTTLSHHWNNSNQSTINFYYRDNAVLQSANHTIRWTPGRDSAETESNNSSFKSYGLVAQHNASFAWLNTKILAGVSADFTPHRFFSNPLILDALQAPDGLSVERYTVRRNDPTVYNINYNSTINNIGAWLQTSFSPVKKISMVMGVRYDRFSYNYERLPTRTQPAIASGKRGYHKVIPRIGATYAISKNTMCFANYSKGFVQANLSTVFNPANPQGLDLAPATFTNYEAGCWTVLLKNKLQAEITFYALEGRNEVVNIRQPDNSTLPTAVGQTLHRGIEYGITYHPNHQIFIRLSATHVLHRFEQFEISKRPVDPVKNVNGKTMPSSPNLMGNAEITYKPKWLTGFRISAEWQRMSEWYQNRVNTVKYSDKGFLGARGISVLNMRAGYSFMGIEVFVNVYNVTDELYANTASRGNNASDRSTFNPGAPRIFNFGFQYSFTAKK